MEQGIEDPLNLDRFFEVVIITTRIDSTTIAQKYVDPTGVQYKIRYQIDLSGIAPDILVDLLKDIKEKWEQAGIDCSEFDLLDAIIDWSDWRLVFNEDGTIKSIQFGSYNGTCYQLIGGIGPERDVVDSQGHSYGRLGSLPISMLVLKDRSLTPDIDNAITRLYNNVCIKHKRIQGMIKNSRFYSCQALIDMLSENICNLLQNKMKKENLKNLLVSELKQLTEFLKLPKAFFKKFDDNPSKTESIAKLSKALETLMENPIFQGLLAIYLEADYFYHKKLLLNAKLQNLVNPVAHDIIQAKEQLDLYIVGRDERLQTYLSNDENSDNYQIALLFILSMFPHDMREKRYMGSIEMFESDEFHYRGCPIVEFGGYSTYIDRSGKPTW